jgi:hypothetical protein
MGISIRSIAMKIGSTSFAAVMAVALAGGAARANEPTVQQRAQAEMNQGKDYVAAMDIATRPTAPAYSPELVARLAKAEAALAQGQDYVTAWAAASAPAGSDFTPEQIAKAKLTEDEINEGMDYVAADEATDEARLPDVQVSGLSDSGDRATR